MNIQQEKYIVTVYNGSEGTKKFRNIAKMHKEIIDTGVFDSRNYGEKRRKEIYFSHSHHAS